MITREIRETACCETDSVHPAEFECMAGDFHHRGVDTAFGHHREQGLQRGRLRRGQRTGYILPGDPDADRADQSHRPARRAQPGLDQVRGGGLAGCSCNAQHGDPIRRVSVDIGGKCPQDRTRGGVHQHRHRCGITEQARNHRQAIRIGEHRDRAGIEGRTGVCGAMCGGAGQCGEQVAGNRVLGAQCDPGDAEIG